MQEDLVQISMFDKYLGLGISIDISRYVHEKYRTSSKVCCYESVLAR